MVRNPDAYKLEGKGKEDSPKGWKGWRMALAWILVKARWQESGDTRGNLTHGSKGVQVLIELL